MRLHIEKLALSPDDIIVFSVKSKDNLHQSVKEISEQMISKNITNKFLVLPETIDISVLRVEENNKLLSS